MRQLKCIENHLVPEYRPGQARFEGLFDYFLDANPELFAHLNGLTEKQAAGEIHSGATYISGASGVGKSYVIGNLPFVKGTGIKPIKLSTLFSETRPDLQSLDGQVVLNRLPWGESFRLEHVLIDRQQQGAPFVLLDELDEIHPETAIQVLRSVEDYVRSRTQGFVHLLVFGRPESFGPWLRSEQRDCPPQVTRVPLELVGPNFQTTGDLAFVCHNYYGYKFSEPAPEDVIGTFQMHMAQYPFLRYTIRPLSAGNFVIKQSASPKSEQALRQGLMNDLLERNTGTHHRPGPGDETYLALLQQAAAYPWHHRRPLDEQGFFSVYPEDVVTFKDSQGVTHAMQLMDVLSRSGLVTMDLSDTKTARYRFDPFWSQGYLLGQGGS